MTKEDFQNCVQEESGCPWIYLQQQNVIIPSDTKIGWELTKQDKNPMTEGRIQFLEDKVVFLLERIKELEDTVRYKDFDD